ncbi:hypothetical protein F6R98_11515 [Candidatus Methylospira mobilis]|uniref:C-type lysozyme inhibitor domain-containing protein n=1 Tax=Candidatus Methylospira mobilis TaxID=1808979 RepID=A0A5Q0BM14_9GAMM|nr:MliC family protein [Candidatus Methylospira mobilis]QFY43168.1 hypothetical protein F6R98_11515 [Candidatus Methylospira mobilis]
MTTLSRKIMYGAIKPVISLLITGLLASAAGPVFSAPRTTVPPRPVAAAPPPLEPSLTLPGIIPLNQQTVSYSCGDGTSLSVAYINTQDGQSFAILPIDGKNRLFVILPSGSGARYCSGPYVWWNKGAEATLWDERNARRPLLGGTCSSGK